MENFRDEVLYKEVVDAYHDLSKYNESTDPNGSQKLKDDIMKLIFESDLNAGQIVGCLKCTLLDCLSNAINQAIDKRAEINKEKFQEEWK